MKKTLLILLLPTLLLTACKDPNKEKEETFAKSLVGTYDFTRKGNIYYYEDTSKDPVITSPINYTGEATITHLGGNRIQLDMGGSIFTASVPTGGNFMFDTYTSSVNTDLLNTTFNIDLHCVGAGTSGNEWVLEETYSGSATGPNVTYRVGGTGRTDLKKK